MQSVEDVFAGEIGFRNESIEVVSGHLLVSKHLVCLCQSDELRTKAILVCAPGLVDEWLTKIPPLAGTMVAYSGKATVTGRLAKSGLSPLPYVFYEVHRVEFIGTHGMAASYEPKAA